MDDGTFEVDTNVTLENLVVLWSDMYDDTVEVDAIVTLENFVVLWSGVDDDIFEEDAIDTLGIVDELDKLIANV